MRLRWMFGAVLLLATLATSGQTLAAGKDSGRLAALAARQDLCDMVCFAMTEGHMNPVYRGIILQQAKSVLSPEEYVSFKRSLDRVAPPPPPRPKMKHKHVAKAVAKPAQKSTPAPTGKGQELVIPASANLPDGVAPPVFLR